MGNKPLVNDPGKRPLLKALFLVTFTFFAVMASSYLFIDEFRLIDLFSDDAYYYFTIGDNIARGQGITFDGVTRTNGFHPLWMACIVAAKFVVNDKILFLRVLGVTSALFFGVVSMFVLAFLGKRYDSAAPLLAGALFFYLMAGFATLGMETTMAIPLHLLTLYYLQESGLLHDLGNVLSVRKALIAGTLLALCQLSRLDSVFFVAAVSGVVALSNLGGRNIFVLNFGAMLAPVMISGLAYIGGNLFYFGTIQPVSGVAKSSGVQGMNSLFLDQLLHNSNWQFFGLMTVLAAVFVIVNLKRALRDRVLQVPVAYSLFLVMFTGYYLFRSNWRLWGWYAYPLVAFSVFVLPHVLVKINPRNSFLARAVRPLTILPLAAFLLIAVLRDNYPEDVDDGSSYKAANYILAGELNALLPSDTTVAMGDRAGSFSYFFEGNVLQMEGIVGDRNYLEAIERGELSRVLKERRVQYIVGYINGEDAIAQYEEKGVHALLTCRRSLSSGPFDSVSLCKADEKMTSDLFLGKRSTVLGVWAWSGASPCLEPGPPAASEEVDEPRAAPTVFSSEV